MLMVSVKVLNHFHQKNKQAKQYVPRLVLSTSKGARQRGTEITRKRKEEDAADMIVHFYHGDHQRRL